MTDLEIERVLAGDLPDSRLSVADRAVADRLRAETDAFLVGADARIARIVAARRRKPVAAGVALAAAAAAVVAWVAVGRRGADPLPPPPARPELRVELETLRGVVELDEGWSVEPGEHLRFVVDAEPGYVAIVAPPDVLVPATAYDRGDVVATTAAFIGARTIVVVWSREPFDAWHVPAGVVRSVPVTLVGRAHQPYEEAPANAD